MGQFRFRLVRQFQDFTGPAAQQLPLLGQCNAMIAPAEQCHAQVRLQLRQLAG